MNLLYKVLNSVFSPSQCVYCKEFSLESICNNCKEKMFFVYDPFCLYCQRLSTEGLTHYSCSGRYTAYQLIVPYYYSGLVRSSIVGSKYSKKQFSLVKELLDYTYTFKDQFNYSLFKDHVFVPVPSDPKRFTKRGFNLPSLICQELSSTFNSKTLEALDKIKETPPLYELTKEKRKKAVHNAYKVKKGLKLPKKVVLVDDIVTTGSTLKESSRVLQRSGVEEVLCFALAFQQKYSG